MQPYGDRFGVQNEASDLRSAHTWSVPDEIVGATVPDGVELNNKLYLPLIQR